MATGSKLWRRIKLTILIVFVLAFALGLGELLRRYFEREELAAIIRVLTEARSNDAPPVEIDPDWESLSKSLRARLAVAPTGQLAIQAHRAVMRFSSDIPGVIALAEQPTARVRFGDLLEREIPVPDHDYLWVVEVQGAWNHGPWIEWYRGAWSGEGWTEGEFAMDTGFSEDGREKATAFLQLRANLKLYMGERAIAAAEAVRSAEPVRQPFVFQEQIALGNFQVSTRGLPEPTRGP